MPPTPNRPLTSPQWSSRDAMLRVGAEMLREMSLRSAWRTLTARQVSKRAGVTTGSFYNYWDTQEQYVAQLVDHVLDPDDLRDELEKSLALGAGGGAPDWVGLCRRHLRRLRSSQRFLTTAKLTGCLDDPAIAKQLTRTHEVEREAYGRLVRSYLNRTGREPLPDVTVDDLGEALAVLSSGYAVRSVATRDEAVAARYARIVEQLLDGLSRPRSAVPAAD